MNQAKGNTAKSSSTNPKINPKTTVNNFTKTEGNTVEKNSSDQKKSALEDLKNKNDPDNFTDQAIEDKSVVIETTLETLYYQIEELKLALENSSKENQEIKLIAQRAVADSSNLTRQHQLDLESSQKKVKKSVANNILHIINTLYLAFQYAPKTTDPGVIKYLETIQQSFEKSLEDLKNTGIEILTAHTGDAIDFTTMNIINNPDGSNDSEPVVAQVVSLGLRIDNQVVQPITVMV